jgi:hypothetical protein
MPTNIDGKSEIENAAALLMRRHGKNAARYAAQWATAFLESGNVRDARKFERIAAALRDPTPEFPQLTGTAINTMSRRSD